MTVDRVFFPADLKADSGGAITGIAWKFDQPDRIGDMIEPGAFKAAKFPLPMLFGHDMADPVGTWDAGEEKAGGWHVTGKLLVDDLGRAREVAALVKSGAVRGLSIGFITKKAATRSDGGRTIKSLELFEVSLVTVPMHPGAKVTSAKSAVRALQLVAAINSATAQIGRN